MLAITLCIFVGLGVIEASAEASGGCNGEHDGYTALTTGTITEPGHYYLTTDLTCETNNPVISIESQGTVTLCLNGFDIYH